MIPYKLELPDGTAMPTMPVVDVIDDESAVLTVRLVDSTDDEASDTSAMLDV